MHVHYNTNTITDTLAGTSQPDGMFNSGTVAESSPRLNEGPIG